MRTSKASFGRRSGLVQPEPPASAGREVADLPGQVDRLEKELVLEALRLHNGNQSRAAGQLGLSERNLRYRLKKWGIK